MASILPFLTQPGDQVVIIPNGDYTGGSFDVANYPGLAHASTTGAYDGFLILKAETNGGVRIIPEDTTIDTKSVLTLTGATRIVFWGIDTTGIVNTYNNATSLWHWYCANDYRGTDHPLYPGGANYGYSPTTFIVANGSDNRWYGCDFGPCEDDAFRVRGQVNPLWQGCKWTSVYHSDGTFNYHSDCIQITRDITNMQILDFEMDTQGGTGHMCGMESGSGNVSGTLSRGWIYGSYSYGSQYFIRETATNGSVMTIGRNNVHTWNTGGSAGNPGYTTILLNPTCSINITNTSCSTVAQTGTSPADTWRTANPESSFYTFFGWTAPAGTGGGGNPTGGGGGTPADSITFTSLTQNYNSTAATSFATASVTPTSGELVLICIGNSNTSTPVDASTVTGTSITGAQKITSKKFNTTGTPLSNMQLWAATGTGSAGAITITFPSSQANCLWHVIEADGVDTSTGTLGVVQSPTNAADGVNNISTTFNAWSQTGNAGFVFLSNDHGLNSNYQFAMSGWTELGDPTITADSSPGQRTTAFYTNTESNPTATTTYTNDSGLIAVELQLNSVNYEFAADVNIAFTALETLHGHLSAYEWTDYVLTDALLDTYTDSPVSIVFEASFTNVAQPASEAVTDTTLPTRLGGTISGSWWIRRRSRKRSSVTDPPVSG